MNGCLWGANWRPWLRFARSRVQFTSIALPQFCDSAAVTGQTSSSIIELAKNPELLCVYTALIRGVIRIFQTRKKMLCPSR